MWPLSSASSVMLYWVPADVIWLSVSPNASLMRIEVLAVFRNLAHDRRARRRAGAEIVAAEAHQGVPFQDPSVGRRVQVEHGCLRRRALLLLDDHLEVEAGERLRAAIEAGVHDVIEVDDANASRPGCRLSPAQWTGFARRLLDRGEERRRFPGPVHGHVDRGRRARRALAVRSPCRRSSRGLLSPIQGLEGAVAMNVRVWFAFSVTLSRRRGRLVPPTAMAWPFMALMCSASPWKSLSFASTLMTTEESRSFVAVSARVTAALFWSSRIVTSPNWSASTCFEVVGAVAVRDVVRDRHLVVAGALRAMS